MNLSTKHLRAFAALALERNFTRAAEKCHLSQPAFSTLMHNLEEQAGVRLFNRTTRSVDLTAEGRLFEVTAQRMLRDFDSVFTALQDHSSLQKGRLVIAALPSVAGGALPPFIAAFRELHPGVGIVLKDITADSCLEAVRLREADMALTAAIEPGTDLFSEPLQSDGFHLVCRDDHPLGRRRELAMRDVADLPQIRFDRRSSIRQHIDAAFYPSQPVTEMEVTNLMTAAGLIASGIGVTLAPTLALFQFRLPGLVAIPVKLPVRDRELCLIRRRGGDDSAAAAAFVELLKSRWQQKPRRGAARQGRARASEGSQG